MCSRVRNPSQVPPHGPGRKKRKVRSDAATRCRWSAKSKQTKIGSSVEVERAQARAHGLNPELIANEEQSLSQGLTSPASFLGKPRLQDENDQF